MNKYFVSQLIDEINNLNAEKEADKFVTIGVRLNKKIYSMIELLARLSRVKFSLIISEKISSELLEYIKSDQKHISVVLECIKQELSKKDPKSFWSAEQGSVLDILIKENTIKVIDEEFEEYFKKIMS